MAADFRSARFWAKELVEKAMFEGACAVDATMGNGHDTQWLCELAGENGHIDAFDVQQDAVERTRERLTAAGLEKRASLYCIGHEKMAEYVKEPADAIVFNLGWLPGAEHGVTTLTKTTLQAVNAALEILREDGLMTVCIYPGHAEGTHEKHALIEWAQRLDEKRFDAMLKTYLNQSNDPPLLIAIRKKLTKKNKQEL